MQNDVRRVVIFTWTVKTWIMRCNAGGSTDRSMVQWPPMFFGNLTMHPLGIGLEAALFQSKGLDGSRCFKSHTHLRKLHVTRGIAHAVLSLPAVC